MLIHIDREQIEIRGRSIVKERVVHNINKILNS